MEVNIPIKESTCEKWYGASKTAAFIVFIIWAYTGAAYMITFMQRWPVGSNQPITLLPIVVASSIGTMIAAVLNIIGIGMGIDMITLPEVNIKYSDEPPAEIEKRRV